MRRRSAGPGRFMVHLRRLGTFELFAQDTTSHGAFSLCVYARAHAHDRCSIQGLYLNNNYQ